jgi:hypothetical protein
MILDSLLAFDGTASAPTTAVAITVTRDSTNILDMGVNRDMSIGQPLYLNIVGDGLFAAAGAATLTIAIQGAPNSSGSPGTWTTYAQTPALSIAQVNSALSMLWPLTLPSPPSGAVSTPRFYKLVYTVATGPFTAGAILAFLAHERSGMLYYASGYTNTYV